MISSETFTLFLGLAIGHLAFLLKNTDFIIEYGKLVYANDFLKETEYNEWRAANNIEHDYPTFIHERTSSLTKNKILLWAASLFRCPWCFSTFICIILSFPSILSGFAAASIAALQFAVSHLLYKKVNQS